MKLSRKLLLGFLSIAMLIWAVGLATVNASRDSLRAAIETNSVEFADTLMAAIDRDVQSRTEFLRQYGEGVLVRETLVESNRTFDELAESDAKLIPVRAALSPRD